MALASQAPEFPYFICKLMIPSVADCHDHRKEYICRRAIALYLVCNAAALGYAKEDSDCSDRKLTRKDDLSDLGSGQDDLGSGQPARPADSTELARASRVVSFLKLPFLLQFRLCPYAGVQGTPLTSQVGIIITQSC